MAEQAIAVDADGHIHEADEMFSDYLDAALGKRTPGFVLNADRNRRMVVDGVEHPPFPKEISIRKPQTAGDRIKVLDKERIGAAVLYPSAALIATYIDAEFAHGFTEAYNSWTADYVRPYKNRLFYGAPIALHDVERGIAEARRAIGLGAVAVAVRPNPVMERTLDDPAYDPLYAAVQELGVPLIIHESTGCPETAGGDRYGMMKPESYTMNHIISHPFEQMFAAMSLICGGVLERFPKLTVGFMEAGCSWVPYWLARLDDHFENRKLSGYMGRLTMKPSEYFHRQCIVSCDPGDPTVALAVQGIGVDKIVFATDYPHFDSAAGAVNVFRETCGVPDADQRRILVDNAVAFYGLDPF